MKYILILVVSLSFSLKTNAQEVLCNVRVSSNEIQSTDKQKFQTLQKAIREFVNNTKWTNDIYEDDERIECNFSISIKEELSTDNYRATFQLQSSRPVHNSNYYSPLFNLVDAEFEFRYIEHQSLDYNENTFTSNLTSFLAYYVYIVIGMDYATFSPNGGAPYFQKAQSIVGNAQSSSQSGWKAFESNKNRYWLAEELLDSKYSDFSQVIYEYHRNGLDLMYDDIEKARGVITASLEQLKKVNRLNPTTYIMRLFFDAKSNEISSLYSEAFQDEKSRVIKLLTELDPSNMNKYNRINEDKSKKNPLTNPRF